MTRPGRPAPTLATALATLAAATAGERPPWCSAALWRDARAIVARAAVELRNAVSPLPTTKRWAEEGRSERTGIGRATAAAWLRGWLAP
jgi:hypothetical protein